MKIRALSAFALAALLTAPVAFSDGDKASPSPAHGGRIVVIGSDPAAHFEVVTDASSGKMTLYALSDGKATLSYGEPVVLVGRRELRLTAVAGETNVWTVTDADLKAATDARLRIRLGDRDVEGALIAADVEAVPTGVATRIEPMHGGTVLLVNDRPFEWVAADGTLTVYAIADAGHPAPLVSSLAFAPAGGKELTFVAVKGETNAWRIEDPTITAALVEKGTLRFSIDGKPAEVRLTGHGKAKVMGIHGGHLLMMEDGSAIEIKRDKATGLVNLWLVERKSDTFADSGLVVSEVPTIEVVTASGPRTITLTAVEGSKNAWTVTDPVFLEKKLDGSIKINVDGKLRTVALWKKDAGMRDKNERGEK